MKTIDDARQLAEVMVAIGVGAKRNTAALLTRMEAPLGLAVGNANEVRESIYALRGEGPADLRELVVALAQASILASGHESEPNSVRSMLEAALDNGSALHSMRQMVEAQGGDPRAIDDPTQLIGLAGSQEHVLLVPADGCIQSIDALDVGLAAAALGGGRGADGAAPDPGVGVELERTPGDMVRKGDPWARLRHRGSKGLRDAQELAERALVLSPEACAPGDLVLGSVGTNS
jgi:thymidine phosphorylase